jgi:hypothetical protein
MTYAHARAAGHARAHDSRQYRPTVRCRECGHPQDWHRHDDADDVPATDPAAKFRCLGYDCEADGALTAARATYRVANPPFCLCPDMVKP